ncbi:expressed unknown protein [Seminavis robusta]|uniref:Uncharacterized protein n=1 Tax=Seminavis robusta TaxID=568900 RepID=A0A9N8D7R3_9STRA|nr:expressed unknown protein [Seminavis robusta]|eukprot:Sro23_g015780.1 n/a (672) ;mRNA; f:71052-73235
MEGKENKCDYNQDTWLSLLGLLHPTEFLVTVDHSQLWRKHVAWSKPDGKELRNFTTQRFSSNMVFMSLILAAEMNVLFNSSQITTDIRTHMINGNYFSLKHWIGLVILLSACVTVIALVSTFTAWGMVSSIGDKNAHCLLRSSTGQLVTSLPSNYVVASLYLFLGWLVLFIIELTKGPVRIVLLLVVTYLFFQTVVSLSAFGRLIIHTGAMGSRPVLDPALEKALLPSGLHASLLIKATDRKRRQTCVMSMYRTPKRRIKSTDSASWSLSGEGLRVRGDSRDLTQVSSLSSSNIFTTKGSTRRRESQRSSPPIDDEVATAFRMSSDTFVGKSPSFPTPTRTSTCSSSAGTLLPPLTQDEEVAIMEAIRSIDSNLQTPRSDCSISSFSMNEKGNLLPDYGPDNSNPNLLYGSISESEDDFRESFGGVVSLPRASVLNNSVNGCDLKKVVEDALSTTTSKSGSRNQGQGETPLRRNGGSRAAAVDKVRFSFRSRSGSSSSNESAGQQTSRRSLLGSQAPSRRSLLHGFRQASVRNFIQAEWNEENDVRDMYDIAPPAEVVFEDEDDVEEDDSDEDIDSSEVVMPHPNVLNSTRRLKSLRRLVSNTSLDEALESVGSTEKRREAVHAISTKKHPHDVSKYDIENAVGGEEDEDDDLLVGENIHLMSSPTKGAYR